MLKPSFGLPCMCTTACENVICHPGVKTSPVLAPASTAEASRGSGLQAIRRCMPAAPGRSRLTLVLATVPDPPPGTAAMAGMLIRPSAAGDPAHQTTHPVCHELAERKRSTLASHDPCGPSEAPVQHQHSQAATGSDAEIPL